MRNRKIAVAAALVTLSLGACGGRVALPSLDLSNAVTLNTMQSVEAAYGIALSAERAYKSLPLCRTGTTATVTAPCAKRSLIGTLQAADLRALSAITAANTFIKTYPMVDATNVISAASAAVSALKGILSSNGIS